MTIFGVHTGLQHTSALELRRLWKRIESLGFEWISIWDHFYAANGLDDPVCLEAVAMQSALACETSKVRCASLVYSVGYRHPAVLANMIATIDQLSGGRADLGLGAGWSEIEYNAYGIPFPSVKTRMDQLEEAMRITRELLHDGFSDFKGEYFQMSNAKCEPRPVQTKIPIWIGGGGERRTLNIAAKYADGWNVPFISPSAFARKNAVLDEHCESVGRDPKEIKRTVNVGIAWTEDSLQSQFGGIADGVRPGVLTGTEQEVVDRIGAYVEAGAEQINLALRAPFDAESLDRFANALGLS